MADNSMQFLAPPQPELEVRIPTDAGGELVLDVADGQCYVSVAGLTTRHRLQTSRLLGLVHDQARIEASPGFWLVRRGRRVQVLPANTDRGTVGARSLAIALGAIVRFV